VETKEGITYNRGDQRDEAILVDIHQHPREAVIKAVKAAREHDPLGRAFPSSVWRHLKKQKQVAGEEDTPPWARVVGNILSPQAEALRGKGGEE